MLEEEETKIAFYVNCVTSLNINREDELQNSTLWGTNLFRTNSYEKKWWGKRNVAECGRILMTAHPAQKIQHRADGSWLWISSKRDICCNYKITECIVWTETGYNTQDLRFPQHCHWVGVSSGFTGNLVSSSSWGEDEDTRFLQNNSRHQLSECHMPKDLDTQCTRNNNGACTLLIE